MVVICAVDEVEGSCAGAAAAIAERPIRTSRWIGRGPARDRRSSQSNARSIPVDAAVRGRCRTAAHRPRNAVDGCSAPAKADTVKSFVVLISNRALLIVSRRLTHRILSPHTQDEVVMGTYGRFS